MKGLSEFQILHFLVQVGALLLASRVLADLMKRWGQAAVIGTAFATHLEAIVTDSFGNPVPGVPVTFTPPSAGPGGSFSAVPLVVTDARGIATAPAFTANHSRGGFTVTATALGIELPPPLSTRFPHV